ncbi:hypothetical protein N7539_004910 [Penicillium diatomitis]|uniref:DEUBAD domain-containing protein n=1 Tax=Penicillium diatomitis TaxID=2819901 RepID=A0A9X0BUI4_9EURO|nr:uncharacterized protein N7539_004910 [Penicillium diatomitis]KAJ5484922.1 hypothetical protein N7539_004910 [Penicillium diatomitis]
MSSPAFNAAHSPPKRNSRKSAPRGKWSEEHLLTSDKSVLIDADLVKLLAKPEAWDLLEEEEKRHILGLLPADIHPSLELPPDQPNSKIPPLPDSFIRYSNNWRDGIRQFQLDLQNGRLDPEWLRQAESARRKRENGDFDSFKEREFERFWGQKQKTQMHVMSGESSKIKLHQLIEAGVFMIGDVWRFDYVWGKGPERVHVAKEVRIHSIDGQKLSFVAPNGQRTFLISPPTVIETSKSLDQSEEPKLEELPHCILSQEIITEANSGLNNSAEVKPEELPMCNLVQVETDEWKIEPVAQNTNTSDMPKDFEAVGISDTENTRPTPKMKGDASTSEKTFIVDDHILAKNSENNPSNDEGLVQVVIVSPQFEEENLKRSIPLPAHEPPTKRKRGRPRKVVAEPPPDEVPTQVLNSTTSDIQVLISAGKPDQSTSGSVLQAIVPERPLTLLDTSPTIVGIKHPDLTSPLSPTRSLSPPHSASEHLDEKFTESFVPVHAANTALGDSKPDQEVKENAGTKSNSTSLYVNSDDPSEAPSESQRHMSDRDPHTISARDLASLPPEKSQDHSSSCVPDEEADKEKRGCEFDEKSHDQRLGREPDEIVIPDISTPMALVKRILQIDGRRADGRTANSWKEIRCYRKNQDMGSLFDVRQSWYSKQQ